MRCELWAQNVNFSLSGKASSFRFKQNLLGRAELGVSLCPAPSWHIWELATFCKCSMKGLVLAQDPQDQIFSTKEINLPQRDKGQAIKRKTGDRGQRRRGKEEGEGAGAFV